jgi:hypothetical protein
MQNILVFAGCKQSGKSSSAKFIHGYRMREAGIINWFDQTTDGDLLVQAIQRDESGKESEIGAILDIYRRDYEFAQYAHERIWPFIKVESFAESLKQTCLEIFSLNPKNLYGTDEDKAELTKISWRDIKQATGQSKKGKPLADYISYRELLQEFGTICRNIKSNCWVEACYSRIQAEQYPYIVIDDCRYENEILFFKEKGAKIVLLTRKKFEDNHSSEKVLEIDRTLFDFVIDNASMTLEQKNIEIAKILREIGWSKAILS